MSFSPGAENSFVALMAQSHVGIAQSDLSARFVHVNRRWAEMLGYTEEELLKLTFNDVTHPDCAVASVERYEAMLRKKAATNFSFEKRYVRKDGSSFWASVTVSMLRAASGEPSGFIAMIIDLSEQRRSRLLIETQNQALQLVLNGAPLTDIFTRLIAMVELESDSVGSILLVDETRQRFRLGAAPSLPEIYNRAVEQVPLAPGVGTCAEAAATDKVVITPDIDSAPSWQAFKHLPLSLGLKAVWSMPIVSAQGRVLGVFGTYFRRSRCPTDDEVETMAVLAKTASLAIERSNSAESLRLLTNRRDQIERLYQAALSTTPDLVYVFDLQHRFTYANEALLSMWGKTWDESIGKTCLQLGYEPWHAEMHNREIDHVAATRRPIRGEVAFTGTNGRRMYDYIFAPVIGANGEVEAVAGTTRDVTDKRKSEEAVRFLGNLVEKLALMTGEEELIRHAVSAVGSYFGAHRCYFVECQESENVIRVSENWCRDAAPSLAGVMNLYDFGGKDWWRAYSRGDFWVEDTTRNPLISAEAAARYEAIAVRSYSVQPVQRQSEWTVVLAATDDVPRAWTQDERDLLREAANRVWPLVERARSEAALREARDEALAASRAKDHFLAALSHELRTPLNPVLLLASEAAANPALPPEVRGDFDTIARNITLEKRLIDDLLDLTGITHDKVVLDLAVHDVHAVLHQSIENVQGELRQKQLELELRFDAPTATVEGDGVRLQQIFWNLLKNAAKFTPLRGRITVTTRIDDAKPNSLIVAVSDTGMGLTADEKKKVFTPFVQGEHAEAGGAKPFGGLGLGLAISRKLTELHSGKLTVESAGRDQGATFTVELPLAMAETHSLKGSGTNTPWQTAGAPRTSRRVLLVEDHEPSRLALARLLGHRQIEVVHAATAAEALERAADQPIDLVISDIGLPDGNGYELMATLRARFGYRGIALSGYGAEADIGRSEEAGFLAHLTKPVRMQALDKLLQQHVGPVGS